uniref:RNA-binding protein PufA n=1 Tax=Platynereis dumerilii TaxID=6359 RepID=L0PQG8_PLADU|nr:RNA-binding protein PufA [Platynereis dumerilii]
MKPKAKKFKKAKVGDESGGPLSKNYQKPLQGGKSGKGKKRPSDSNDDSWEQAVKKARGAPDGESDGSALSVKGDNSGHFKDGKKKPFKAIKSAADFIKKFNSKGDKTGEKGEEDENEKAKLENMTVKQRKELRKKKKNNYDTCKQAKAIWEQLRVKSLAKDKKKVLSEELFQLVQGKAKEMIFTHDMSRVVQCLMKYGSMHHRNKLFEELRNCIVDIMKSKYAKFFVKKLLKYGTKAQRDYVFRSIYGKVSKLVRHKEAAEVVEYALHDFANAAQRAAVIEEFYGTNLYSVQNTRISNR